MPAHRAPLRHPIAAAAMLAIVMLAATSARAAIWSNTEMHLQYGSLDTPFTGFIEEGLEESKGTLIITLQHASGWWILGQPQFRYYVNPDLAIGIEWQFWLNKLGDPDTDENAVQALLVWVF